MTVIDLKSRTPVTRWPRIYRDVERVLDAMTRDRCEPECDCLDCELDAIEKEKDPAPCSHCGQTDHDSDHCPGQGG